MKNLGLPALIAAASPGFSVTAIPYQSCSSLVWQVSQNAIASLRVARLGKSEG
jgi:hypothetical protein